MENEQFGVEELAQEVGMSRSQLHRKLQTLTGQSASQFIKQVRLERAMEMLQNEVGTASEIAYKVGFGSPTYFTKSFHDHFGFPPGEVKKRQRSSQGESPLSDKPPTQRKRQLAAIMFSDIVGYTVLMGSDEDKALELLNKNRRIQKPIIEELNGKWLKEMGDGVMASFGTVSDAVLGAKRILEASRSVEDLQLRIGIHQGEVVFDRNDVFGDGVNIASRLQQLASPNSILISESVYKNIKKQTWD